jgi:hypothetical protein
MTGYVTPCKSELLVREFEVYNAYYCAVCKSIAARLGQLPRLLLSYDSAFWAMMFAAPGEGADSLKEFRCVTHPGRKRNVGAPSQEIDYAADMMVLLGYENLKDDLHDEHKLRGAAGCAAAHRAYKKVSALHPEKAEAVRRQLAIMHETEKAREKSIDFAAEPFAVIMEEVFGYHGLPEHLKGAYRLIGRHLGRWIYMADAVDDYAEDMKSGSYNPLLCEHYEPARLAASMELTLASIAETADLLPLRRNKGLLENIIYVGLRLKTETLLKEYEEITTNAKPI